MGWFKGRARRREYWRFAIFNFVVSFLVDIVGNLFFNTDLLYVIWVIIILIPFLAVSVRRLHDIGRSGWWLLINLIPVIGWLIAIYWLYFKNSQDGTNNYGENPKEEY